MLLLLPHGPLISCNEFWLRHPMQETESGLCWNKDWNLICVWPFHWQIFFVGELEGSLTSRTPQPLLFGGERVIQVIPNFSAFGSGQVLTPQSRKDHMLEKKRIPCRNRIPEHDRIPKKNTYTPKNRIPQKNRMPEKIEFRLFSHFFLFHFFFR